MKCLLLLSFVALSYASGDFKFINIRKDGVIDIKGVDRKYIIICRSLGKIFIIFLAEWPKIPTTKILTNEDGSQKSIRVQNGPDSFLVSEQYGLNDLREKRSSREIVESQADLLYSLFKKYEGIVDEKTYESLLKKVEEYVKFGELDSSILNVLKYLRTLPTNSNDQISNINIDLPKTSTSLRDYIWYKYQDPSIYENFISQWK